MSLAAESSGSLCVPQLGRPEHDQGSHSAVRRMFLQAARSHDMPLHAGSDAHADFVGRAANWRTGYTAKMRGG
jgi:hypothetical protein